MKRQTRGVAALLGASLLALSAAAADAKTLVFCSEGSPEGFNPAFYTAGTTFDASSRPIYSRLIEIERGGTKLLPGLAESWEVSKDGLEYTFKLRKGVKFQTTAAFTPTRDFNADDVLFSFLRQHKADHPYHKVSNAGYEYYASNGFPELVKDIVKVDDMTVKILLTKPEAPMIAHLAMDFASIFSAEYADKMLKAGTPEKVDLDPVGTGPFQLASYQKDAVIRYKAHPGHYRGKALIDDLVFSITKDASVRWQKVKAGECHLMPYPNPADLAEMKKDKSVNVLSQPGFNIAYVGYNVEKKPFDNPKVRQALNMAINKEAILKAVFEGEASIAKNPIPPTLWSYNEKTVDDKYDPEGAKKLLAEAGHPNGFEVDFWYMPVQRPYNPNGKRMGELIQADWEKIGVKAKLVTYEWKEYLSRTKNGDQMAFQLGWTGDIPDPDNFLNVLLSCGAVGSANRARWCDKEFDGLVVKAKQLSDTAERTKLYEEAQLEFKKEAPWATIAHSVVYKPIRKEVVDFKISPFGHHEFYGVDIKQ